MEPVLTDSQRTALAALADLVIPPDDAPGGAEAGAVPFIENLLRGDRVADQPKIVALLNQFAAGAPQEAWDTAPAFRLLAELVHESYWTSAVGKAVCGFVERG